MLILSGAVSPAFADGGAGGAGNPGIGGAAGTLGNPGGDGTDNGGGGGGGAGGGAGGSGAGNGGDGGAGGAHGYSGTTLPTFTNLQGGDGGAGDAGGSDADGHNTGGGGGGGAGGYGIIITDGEMAGIDAAQAITGGDGGAGGAAGDSLNYRGTGGGGGDGGIGLFFAGEMLTNEGVVSGGNGGFGGGLGDGVFGLGGTGGDGGLGISFSGNGFTNEGGITGGSGGDGGSIDIGFGSGDGGNGGAGGAGLAFSGDTLRNQDSIAGGNGGLGGSGGPGGWGYGTGGKGGTGGDGGVGAVFSGGMLTNEGAITGGNGNVGGDGGDGRLDDGTGGNGGDGGAGGIGVSIDAGDLTNNDTIFAGAGGAGGGAGDGDGGAGVSGNGGDGGVGVSLGNGTLINNGTIRGNIGGLGGSSGYDGASDGGVGGLGGAGVTIGDGQLTNTDEIIGGTGGNGGFSDDEAGGDAGDGGNGIDFGGSSLTSSGSITGGAGGNGGDGISGAGDGGGGGSGLAFNGDSLTNDGVVAGGVGGVGGDGNSVGGNGGLGGAGIVLNSGTLTNTGDIIGGDAGYDGSGADGSPTSGGVGVLAGPDVTIVNSGTISSGLGSDGTQANAITFTGGANTLRFLNATSGLTGNIGVTGTLTFDQDAIDTEVANVITGTGAIVKRGGATVRLSGANTFAGGTTILGGVIEASHVDGVGRSDALGSGLITLAGGTLRSTLGASTLNSYLISAGTTGTITAAPGTNLNINGSMGLSFTVDGDVIFGSATDTGTIVFQPVYAPIAATSEVLVAGGSLVNGNGTVGDMTGFAAATRVNAGATLDFGNFTAGIRNLQDGPTGGGTVDWQSDLNIAAGDFSGTLAGPGALIKDTSGTLTLSGDSSGFTGNATVSEGTLDITGQFASSQGTIDYTGSDPDATATARVSGSAASWVSSGGLTIGAKGALIAENGGDIASGGDNHVGFGGGVVTVTGPGSTWTTNRIMVGDDGGGELNITDGGEVNTASSSFIGGWDDYNGWGTATVNGAGSTWNVGASLNVGSRGTGELTIANGGEVNQESAFVGSSLGFQGTVLVTGKDSKWISRDALIVGFLGIGEVTIEAGGYVESEGGTIGALSDPLIRGAMTVVGQDSRWSNSGELDVGSGGNGTLTIADGGVVSATQMTIADSADGIGTLNIGAAAGDAAMAAGALDVASVAFGEGDGLLVFNHTGNPDGTDLAFDTVLSGNGTVLHENGTTLLTGYSSGFNGTTMVTGGTLSVGGTLGGTATVGAGGTLIVGDDSHATASFAGDVNVNTGGTLGGIGTIGGDVDIDGILSAGNSPGTLTVGGDLTLNGGSTSVFELNTPGVVGGSGAGGNDLVEVGGDLSLGGTLDARVAAAGYYRLFDYGGTLTGTFAGGTLTGTGGFTPLFSNSPDIRYDTPQQVNLSVLAAGQTMLFWDGGNTSANGATDGGTGTWSDIATNWTNETGSANGSWGGSVGVFAGSAGTVTVDGTQGFDTLQFKTDGYTLTGGTLALNPASGTAGTFNIDNGVSATIGSTITDGTGTALKKAGGGTLSLTGANSYTGGTLLLGGALSVSVDANLGAPSGDLIFDGGTLATTADMQSGRDITLRAIGGTFQTGASLNMTGTISGDGSLTKTGSGTLTLTGTNGYRNTWVRDGILVGDADSISGGIGNDATVVFDQGSDGTFAGNIGSLVAPGGVMVKQGAGNLTLTGDSGLDWSIKAGGLSTAAGRFGGNADIAAGASLTFEQPANAIYNGALTGAGRLIKTGTGTLAYHGDGSGFSGVTTIDTGKLIVGLNMAHADAVLGGSFDVEDGGTLGGHGTIGSGTGSTVTIASGGTIAPGNSIGTLTVDGDLIFDAGSIYLAEINPALDSDLIDASGTATINGGTVYAAKVAGTYTPGSRWTILSADGGVAGRFDALGQNMPFVDLALNYDDLDHVYLDVTRNTVAFCDVAMTSNQCSTGDGLENTGAGNPVRDAVAALPDEESARQALDSLSGEIHASIGSALIEDSHFVRDAVNDRIRAAFGDSSTPFMPVMAYGPGGPRPVSPDSFGPVAWGQAFGAWGTFDGGGNAAGMDTSTGGFLTGIDGEIASNVRLGFLAGYSHSSFDVDERASSGSSDNYHLGLYAGGKWDALRLSGGLAYTWHDIETSRSVVFPGFSDRLSGDYNAGTFQAFGEAGYRIDAGALSFEPFANLAYVNLHTDGFTEKGGAAALHVYGETTDATFTTLGVHLSSAFDLGGMNATAHGTLGWRHAFGDTMPISTHAFAGGDPFTITGMPIAEDAAIIEVGFDLDLTDNTTLGLSYSGQIASKAQQHGVNARLNVRF